MAWTPFTGKVSVLRSYTWPSGSNVICFKLRQDNGVEQGFSVRVETSEADKNRTFVMLLAAQMGDKYVIAEYLDSNVLDQGCDAGNTSEWVGRPVQSVRVLN